MMAGKRKAAGLAAAALVACALAGTAAQAATIYADKVDWSGDTEGFVTVRTPNSVTDNTKPGNALGTPNNNFLSLGLGGFAVFGFSSVFAGASIVFETTSGAEVDEDVSTYLEYVDVYVGNVYTAGQSVSQMIANGFTLISQGLSNVEAEFGALIPFTGSTFSYVLLVDRTAENGGATGVDQNGDAANGFDVKSVAVFGATPAATVPLPAGAGLLLTAMGGFAIARRLRKTA